MSSVSIELINRDSLARVCLNWRKSGKNEAKQANLVIGALVGCSIAALVTFVAAFSLI